MNIVNLKVEELIPYINNPRNNTEAVDKVAASIKEFGFKVPIVIDKDNVVVTGHTRLLASKKLGLQEVPCVIADDLSPAQIKAFRIADNKVSEYAEWDEDMLKLELEQLEEMDFDLDELNIDYSDFDLDIGEDIEEIEPEEVEVPEVPEEPKAKLGDIYQLGNHRLMCGDSTSIDDIEKLMNGEIADITFTSPPYNAGQTPTEVKMNNTTKYDGNDDNKSESEYTQFLNDYLHNTLLFSQYSFMNVQSISNNKISLIDVLYQNKDVYADTIIWDKMYSQPAMAKNVLNSEFEYVHIFSKKANRAIGTKEFRGTLSNIIHISKQNRNEFSNIHNATFSIEFANYFVKNFAEKSVLDPFGGTGSTLIACEQLNRNCFMMELEPKYIDVIIERWEDYTGNKAVKLE